MSEQPTLEERKAEYVAAHDGGNGAVLPSLIAAHEYIAALEMELAYYQALAKGYAKFRPELEAMIEAKEKPDAK